MYHTWRVWAPGACRVDLHLVGADISLSPTGDGYHQAITPEPDHGTRYRYSLDGGEPIPDPRSRWQPDGVFGDSAHVVHGRFVWEEGSWAGVARQDLVIYELHIGTFTPHGTFDSAIPELEHLAALGFTAIQPMPIAQFSGRYNWGYDGVYPFAPHNFYGGPEGFKRFVAAAHRAGMAVILDVVYNHFGPEGNYYPQYGEYTTATFKTPWGDALDFTRAPVREMILESVIQWVRDYRVDGLRLDSTHNMYDASDTHILTDIARTAHHHSHGGRPCHVIAEDDRNDVAITLGKHELDGQWNDDFHHAVHIAVTGENTSLYSDYEPAHLARAVSHGFIYNGRYSKFRGREHGRRLDTSIYDGSRLVHYIQNHDWVGNRPNSDRLSTIISERQLAVATAFLLLSPGIPLLFMGEEYRETAPFPFFCDFRDEELRRMVREGRIREVAHLGRIIPLDPGDIWTFLDAKLTRRDDWSLLRDLLALRAREPGLRDMAFRPSAYSQGMLVVVRGDGIRVCYNLGDKEALLPSGEILFRTGEGSLGPWDFAVIRIGTKH